MRVKKAAEPEEPVDKTALESLLANAPDIQTDINYYHSNDFWNGTPVLPKINDDTYGSFWGEYLIQRASAEALLLDDTAKQADINKEVTDLQASIDALIPVTVANASFLYDEVECSRKGNPYYADEHPGQKQYKDTYNVWKAAYEDGVALLGSLYSNGIATEYNTPERQTEIDDLIVRIASARINRWLQAEYECSKRSCESGKRNLPLMIALAKGLTDRSLFTADSWDSFQTNIEYAESIAAKYEDNAFPDIRTEAETAVDELDLAYRKVYYSYYYGLIPVDSIEISLKATDPMSARSGNNSGISGYTGKITLEEGKYTLADALEKAGIEYGTFDEPAVYINNVFVHRSYVEEKTYDPVTGGLSYYENKFDMVLHPGDEVRVAWNYDPWTTVDQTFNNPDQAELFQYLDSLNIMNFEEDIAGATLEVEAGKEFTLTTRLVNAILGYTGEWSVAPNMTLFISNSAADDKGNQKELNKLTSGMDQIMSGEDGKVSVTLYKEGCYVITAYDLADDKMGHLDNDMGMDTAGTYHSTNAGAIIRVKVLHSNDEAAVKASLISELEEKSAEMPEEQFRPEDWQRIQAKVEEGTAAVGTAEDLGTARDAQQEAIKAIQQIQRKTKKENEENPATVRVALSKLPDDVSLISVTVDNLVTNLIETYDALSDYQKTLLTVEEKAKCEAIKERAESEDYQTPVTFKITVKNEADTAAATSAIQAMSEWMNEHVDNDGYGNDEYGGNGFYVEPLPAYQLIETDDGTAEAVKPLKQTRIFTGLDYAAYLKVKMSATRSFAAGDSGVTIKDSMEDGQGVVFTGSGYDWTAVGHFAVMVGETEYRLAGISYDGIDEKDVKYDSWTVHDYEGKYKQIPQQMGITQNVAFPDSRAKFNMPFNDVTVTLNWEPVDVDKLKDNAKAAVNDAFDAYDPDDYFQEDFDEIEAIKDAVIEAIDEATLSTEVTPAKKQAIREMADVPTKAEVKDAAKAEIEEKFNAVDTSEMNDDEKAALAKAKEDALKAVDDAEKKEDVTKAGTDADSAIGDIKTDSEARIAKEAADAAAADAVIAKIDALKEVSDLALSDKSTVEAARAAYDALTDDQKALIPAAELQKLKNSEAIITALQDKVDAEAEAAEAEKLKKAAEEAAKAAEQKQKEAEEAAKAAEQKQKAAEEAAKTAEQKQKEAEEAAKAAAQKQKEAEEAAKAAAEKQGESEEAAKIAAQKQKEAEEAAAIAAQKQKEAEETAKTAEQKQKEAEDAAKAAEQKQKEAESAAKEAADKLKAAEEALKKAEEDLAKAEQNEFEALTKVKLSKKTKGSKEKITVRWTKVKGAKGYEILVAKNKKGTKSPLTYKAGKKASKKIIKKLKKGRYFVKVRAYKVIKGNTVYGKYSKAKKVNVK